MTPQNNAEREIQTTPLVGISVPTEQVGNLIQRNRPALEHMLGHYQTCHLLRDLSDTHSAEQALQEYASHGDNHRLAVDTAVKWIHAALPPSYLIDPHADQTDYSPDVFPVLVSWADKNLHSVYVSKRPYGETPEDMEYSAYQRVMAVLCECSTLFNELTQGSSALPRSLTTLQSTLSIVLLSKRDAPREYIADYAVLLSAGGTDQEPLWAVPEDQYTSSYWPAMREAEKFLEKVAIARRHMIISSAWRRLSEETRSALASISVSDEFSLLDLATFTLGLNEQEARHGIRWLERRGLRRKTVSSLLPSIVATIVSDDPQMISAPYIPLTPEIEQAIQLPGSATTAIVGGELCYVRPESSMQDILYDLEQSKNKTDELLYQLSSGTWIDIYPYSADIRFLIRVLTNFTHYLEISLKAGSSTAYRDTHRAVLSQERAFLEQELSHLHPTIPACIEKHLPFRNVGLTLGRKSPIIAWANYIAGIEEKKRQSRLAVQNEAYPILLESSTPPFPQFWRNRLVAAELLKTGQHREKLRFARNLIATRINRQATHSLNDAIPSQRRLKTHRITERDLSSIITYSLWESICTADHQRRRVTRTDDSPYETLSKIFSIPISVKEDAPAILTLESLSVAQDDSAFTSRLLQTFGLIEQKLKSRSSGREPSVRAASKATRSLAFKAAHRILTDSESTPILDIYLFGIARGYRIRQITDILFGEDLDTAEKTKIAHTISNVLRYIFEQPIPANAG